MASSEKGTGTRRVAKAAADKVRGPIVAGDQGSHRGHHCGQAVSGTALVYYCIPSSLCTGTVHSVQWCYRVQSIVAMLEQAGDFLHGLWNVSPPKYSICMCSICT